MNPFRYIKQKWDNWYYHDIDDGPEEEWEESIPVEQKDYFDDANNRTVYVLEALSQMAESAEKCDFAQAEYDAVTSFLRDIEEIENLPFREKQEIMGLAQNIVNIEKDRKNLFKKSTKLPDHTIDMIERYEREIPDAIKKIREAEDYRKLVKKDLKRLDHERRSNRFQIKQHNVTLMNSKGVATIILVAMLFTVLILFVMSKLYEYDVRIGLILATMVGAISLTVLFVKYNDAGREIKKLYKIENKLITIHNTVKIRYVNNTNLLNYYYMKYDIEGVEDLEENWRIYTDEFAKRVRDEKLKADLEHYFDRLTKMLRKYRVQDPEIWTRQAAALVDPREMVEVRHALNTRRSKLREQVDYNKKVAEDASLRIKTLASLYPKYVEEINLLLDKYGNPESLL